MRNIIYILIDALSYKNYGKTMYRNSCTPFIDFLAQTGIEFRNMFSLAPYTEAAFISSLAGERTLENGGYLKGVANCKQLLAEKLKEKGYRTYSTYSPYIYSSSYIRGIDCFLYSRIYSLQILLDYRMVYYRQKYFSGNLVDRDYLDCIDILIEGLSTWKMQVIHILKQDICAKLIKEVKETDAELQHIIKKIEIQLERIKSEKKLYLVELFEQWENHDLIKINTVTWDKKANRAVSQYIQAHYLEELRKIDNIASNYNTHNNKIDWGGMRYRINLLRNDGIEKGYRMLKERIKYKKNISVVDAIINGDGEQKVTVSAKMQLDFFQKIANNSDDKIPFYMFIHLEDFHAPSMFYSYDIEDYSLLDQQLYDAIKYVDRLGKNYKGNIRADISALYLDNLIKDFYMGIDESIRDNTYFAIAADHGFPFNYNPPRPTEGNDFYLENYRIPFIVNNRKTLGREVIDDIVSSTKIYQILNNIADYDELKYNNCNNNVIIEHLGAGCPDIFNREVNYLIVDNRFAVGIKCKLIDDISYDKINCIYRIDIDGNQYFNIKKKELKKKNIQLERLIGDVRDRHIYLRKKFLNS